jgi:hypothetical protein
MNSDSAQLHSPEPPDFSLVLGGPLYQLLRRAHLTGVVLELVWCREIFFVLLTWLRKSVAAEVLLIAFVTPSA